MTEQVPSETKKNKGKRCRRWAVELTVVLLAVAAIQWWQARDSISGQAPELQGRLLSGETFSLASLKGAPVLVHFWATWCPICRLEEDSIDGLAEDFPVITIATTSGEAAEVRAYLVEKGLDFPVLLDESGDIGREWGVKGVPASFILDGGGRIAHATVGYSSGIGLRLRLWLTGL